MDKFIEEVNKLSVNVKSSKKNKEIPDENSPAIDSLFSYAKAGVNTLKSKVYKPAQASGRPDSAFFPF